MIPDMIVEIISVRWLFSGESSLHKAHAVATLYYLQ